MTTGQVRRQMDAVETLQRLLEPLSAYPRWLVITCLVLAGIAAAWLLAKLAKWAVTLAVIVAVAAAVVLAAAWLLR